MATARRKTITRKQYRDAYRAFCVYLDAWCEAAAAKYPHLEFHWDEMVALNASVAAYDDIDRYKSYHLRNRPGSRSNVVKRAAYFCKWISRLHPVMFKRKASPAASSEDLGLLINEALAIAWAMELISDDINRDIKLSLKSTDELLYDLHYREIDTDGLLAWFQIIFDLAMAGQPNPVVEFSL